MADEVRKALAALYREFYKAITKMVRESGVALEASNSLSEGIEGIELATSKQRIRELIDNMTFSTDALQKAANRVSTAMKRVMNRSGKAALTELGASASWSADSDSANEWLEAHLADVFTSVQRTTKDQVIDFVSTRLDEGVESSDALANDVEHHFSSFDVWRSELAARSEIRDAFNAGTLLAGVEAGVKQAQAGDGVSHDEVCRNRNGKIFPITAALRERDHPAGELHWKLLPPKTEITVAEASKPDADNALAWLDGETVYFHESVSSEDRRRFLISVVDFFRNS
jgi:hypothetical protein